jgi:predicted RNA-binding protein with EMAP domain
MDFIRGAVAIIMDTIATVFDEQISQKNHSSLDGIAISVVALDKRTDPYANAASISCLN